MNQAPPPAQTMTADPSVVDAAVRFCDDALASPTVEFLKPVESNVKIINNFWSKTVTIQIANPAGEKVLSIIIEIPEYDVWHGSVVTAEGVCVARVSQEFRARFRMRCSVCDPLALERERCVDAPPVSIEWGGAHFGEVNHDFNRDLCVCNPNSVKPIAHAQGPVDRIDSAEDPNSTRNKLCKLYIYSLALPVFGVCLGLLCGIPACMCYPLEFHIKDSAGEKVRGFERPALAVDDFFRSPGVLHFERMTSEQRRLALVVGMYSTAQRLCHPQEGGGG